jgi:hypothetical protein
MSNVYRLHIKARVRHMKLGLCTKIKRHRKYLSKKGSHKRIVAQLMKRNSTRWRKSFKGAADQFRQSYNRLKWVWELCRENVFINFQELNSFVGNLCAMYIIELISNLYGTKDNVPMNSFKDYSVSMCVYSFGRN